MSIATLERKSVDLRVKSLGDGGSGSYRIYAASFGNVDRQGEMIQRGAFRNLDEFVKDGFMAVGHDHKGIPIGTITSAVQDDYGLLVTGEFHSTPEAQDARRVMMERMQRGKSVKASIGYVVTDDARGYKDGKPYRLLKGIDLIEFSWVNIPASPLAHAVEIKGTGHVREAIGHCLRARALGVGSALSILEAEVCLLSGPFAKEGRTLSEATRRRLLLAIQGVKVHWEDLAALLEQHAPALDATASVPAAPGDAAKRLRRDLMRQMHGLDVEIARVLGE